MAEVVGVVAELWRYPVKSLQGERLLSVKVTPGGVMGDRAYAVIDGETGYIASAKHPRKWQALLMCQARYVVPPSAELPIPPVELVLPDGQVVRSDETRCDQVLSAALGRAVRLVKEPVEPAIREANRAPVERIEREEVVTQEGIALAAPGGTFFDVAPLHLITDSTLAGLRRACPGADFDIRRFRANIVIRTNGDGGEFVENGWLGKVIELDRIGIEVIDPCPRCVVTTLRQGELKADIRVLKTVVSSSSAASLTLAPGVMFAGVAGVYGRAWSEGDIVCRSEVKVAHPITQRLSE